MQATVRNALCAKSNSATPHPAIGVSEKYVLRLGSKAMLGSHGLICIHYFPTASHRSKEVELASQGVTEAHWKFSNTKPKNFWWRSFIHNFLFNLINYVEILTFQHVKQDHPSS